MNDRAWDLHLENLKLRKRLQTLAKEVDRQKRAAATWRERSLRATRFHDLSTTSQRERA